MGSVIEIPDERLAQVALSFRDKANEFHGYIARNPLASCVSEWKAAAKWFDAQADNLLAKQSGPVRFK